MWMLITGGIIFAIAVVMAVSGGIVNITDGESGYGIFTVAMQVASAGLAFVVLYFAINICKLMFVF